MSTIGDLGRFQSLDQENNMTADTLTTDTGVDMPDFVLDVHSENLIKDYVVGSVAVSVVPVAIFDIAAVVGIQLRMIQKLSELHDKPFSDKIGRKVIYALIGGFGGYGVGYVVAASAFKLIPGIGWAVGMASLPLVAGASTFAVGKSVARHYEQGGTLLDFNAKSMRQFYDEQFEKGKSVAKRSSKNSKATGPETAVN